MFSGKLTQYLVNRVKSQTSDLRFNHYESRNRATMPFTTKIKRSRVYSPLLEIGLTGGGDGNPLQYFCLGKVFPQAKGTFSRKDHILGHKSSLDKFKKIEIMSNIFSDHHTMRLDINYRKKKTVKNNV